MIPEGEYRLARLQEGTGEKTKTGTIDVAVKNYSADLPVKHEVAPALVVELANPFGCRGSHSITKAWSDESSTGPG